MKLSIIKTEELSVEESGQDEICGVRFNPLEVRRLNAYMTLDFTAGIETEHYWTQWYEGSEIHSVEMPDIKTAEQARFLMLIYCLSRGNEKL